MVIAPSSEAFREPFSDEPELEHSLHLTQIVLLLTCLEWWWQDRQDFFAAGNLSIYFRPEQLEKNTFVGPDFFVVLETQRRQRGSWMVSLEGGKFPNLIVEVLSPKTARGDRTTKKQIYQDVFQTPEYFWFNPHTKRREFKGFRLRAGVYEELLPTDQGWLWSEELQLYLGVTDGFLRYFTPEGVMVPNFQEETSRQGQIIAAIQARLDTTERRLAWETRRWQQESLRAEQESLRAEQESLRAEQESLRAEQESHRAEQESLRAERLAAQLRSLGVNPDALE